MIERDPHGSPTGTLRDNATDLGTSAMPVESLEKQVARLRQVLAGMYAVGITSVQEASADEHLMQIYRALYEAKQLDMRVRACFKIRDLKAPVSKIMAEAQAFRSKWTVDPDRLRADAVKIFADGVIEYPSHTAAMLEPYLNRDGSPGTDVGPSYFTAKGLGQIVTAADGAGFTVHIHAVGDRAVRSSLDAIGFALNRNGRRDNRHQIAHLELVDPEDFPRFKTLGVIANFQLLWAIHEPYIDAGTEPYLGAKRGRYLYPARSLEDAGALIVGGSDWDVSSYDPFLAIEHGITRSEKKGARPLLPEQGLSLADMIDAYTVHAAFALKQETTTGSLESGKRADFVVLDRDIFALDPFDLHKTRVLQTYIDGREVFHRAGT
jgi:predicted amidohydrolase YtcJ